MKWTIHELIKRANSDIDLDQKLDLSRFLSEDFNDVIDILDTSVSGKFEYLKAEETFAFFLNVKTTLVMLCSLTLKKVNVNLDFNTDLYFSRDFIDDDTHIIDGITIDLDPYIFSEIITEKPMRVVSRDAYEEYSEEVEKLDEEEIVENSPFAKLKK
ncbi:MAG: YceD family protein [Candidatus Izimaplasma sp.]|nr:YceD family protein [Candidatus Izimaplasma bacterium]